MEISGDRIRWRSDTPDFALLALRLTFAIFRLFSSSYGNPLNFIERDFVIAAVVEFGRPRRFMVGDLLRNFQLAAVFQIRRNAGRAEGMIADAGFDAGRFCAAADDAVGVLLEEGIGCQLAGFAAGTAEEIAVDVIGDAGRFDILLQAK